MGKGAEAVILTLKTKELSPACISEKLSRNASAEFTFSISTSFLELSVGCNFLFQNSASIKGTNIC
jgi:hypothetical protein